MSKLIEELSLAADLLANHPPIDSSSDNGIAAITKLALCLERDDAHRGGLIKQDTDLVSLHRVCIAARSIIAGLGDKEPSHEDVVRWCIPLHQPITEILIKHRDCTFKTRTTDLGRRLSEKVSGTLTEKLKASLPDTTPQLGPDDKVLIETGDPNDKIGQLDRIIERSGFFEHLEAAWQKSGKRKDEFTIALKPNLMMIFRLSDDGTYTDTVLVTRLIEKIIERGFSNIVVVEAQNLYGNWYGNREVIKVAAHGGYLDRKVFDTYERGKDYFGYVLVRGEKKPFKIVDMTYDYVPYRFEEFGLGEHNLGRAWVEADYRIDFPKFKTHFFNFYTVCVKNTYGCLPAQDKIKHYHKKKITHQLTAAQLAHFPVHFSFVDAITGADGILGAKMKADSIKPGLLLAGIPMLAIENVCAQMMGYDPYCSAFFVSAVKVTGNLHAVKIEGSVEPLPKWKKVPKFVNSSVSFGESFYRLGLHFGHTFTGQSDPCFPHTGKFIILRRMLSILPYPVLLIANMDQVKVRFFRYRMRKFCKKHADIFPLSSTSKEFFNLIYNLSLKDMATLADFLEKHAPTLADEDTKIERFGHRVRVKEQTIEFVGMKHFVPASAAEILEGIRNKKFGLGKVKQELNGWRTIEMPNFLRKHLLIDSPYTCGGVADLSKKRLKT